LTEGKNLTSKHGWKGVKMDLVVALDIGGTLVKGAMVDREGNTLDDFKLGTLIGRGANDFVARLGSYINTLRKNAAAKGDRVLAIGMGVAGKILQKEGKIVFSPNLMPLNNYPLASELQKRTMLPVFMDNDANAFGIGERWKGAGREHENWLGITLGTGVGGVLILNGERWQGDDVGFVGEIGHTIVYPEGPLCNCGKRGCLEALSSATALTRGAKEAIEKGEKETELAEAYERNELNPILIADAAGRGDKLAVRLFERFGHGLGIAISNTFNLLGITTCIIGGGVSAAWPRFIDEVWKTLREVNSMVNFDQVVIKRASLGNRAAVLGAARLAWIELGKGH